MTPLHTKLITCRATEDEHKEIKLAATKAGISIKKYVRLKLGLDKEGKK